VWEISLAARCARAQFGRAARRARSPPPGGDRRSRTAPSAVQDGVCLAGSGRSLAVRERSELKARTSCAGGADVPRPGAAPARIAAHPCGRSERGAAPTANTPPNDDRWRCVSGATVACATDSRRTARQVSRAEMCAAIAVYSHAPSGNSPHLTAPRFETMRLSDVTERVSHASDQNRPPQHRHDA